MYSRVTQLEIDTVRADVDEALALFRERVLPHLREQEGFEGVLVLATPDGKGILISFWESEEAAAAGVDGGHYADAGGRPRAGARRRARRRSRRCGRARAAQPGLPPARRPQRRPPPLAQRADRGRPDARHDARRGGA